MNCDRSAQGMKIQPSKNTILAELGSLNLEFTRLTQLTNDPKYFDAAQRVINRLEEAQNQTRIPGLWPIMVDAEELTFDDPRYAVGGMADSAYEYLPKEHLLLGARTDQFRNMYAAAMDPIKKRVIFRGNVKGNNDGQHVLFPGNTRPSYGNHEVEPQMEHLKCYLGGTVGIGAKIFNRPEELSIARGLVDGCIWAHEVMPTGIMPEIMHVSPCEEAENCEWDERKWHRDVRRRRGGTGDVNKDVKTTIKNRGLQPGVTEISDTEYKLRYAIPPSRMFFLWAKKYPALTIKQTRGHRIHFYFIPHNRRQISPRYRLAHVLECRKNHPHQIRPRRHPRCPQRALRAARLHGKFLAGGDVEVLLPHLLRTGPCQLG